jgi:Holliday junction resolvase
MPNKNYLRGVKKERDAVRELIAMGYTAGRSAGSKGVFDVIGLGPRDSMALQVKRVRKPCNNLKAFRKDLEQIKNAQVSPNTKKALWVWIDRKGWEKIEVGKAKGAGG